jgi:hypothetical protein
MKKLFISFIAVLSFSANADFIERDWRNSGDKLITLDTVSGLEWLDLSYTANPIIPNTLANVYRRTKSTVELGYEFLNYDLTEWRVASQEEVKVLLSHAFPTLPVPFDEFRLAHGPSIEWSQKQNFIELFGGMMGGYCKRHPGTAYASDDGLCYFAGISGHNLLVGTDDESRDARVGQYSVWLVRGEAIPEEGTCPEIVTEMSRQQAIDYIQHLATQLADPTTTVITPLQL